MRSMGEGHRRVLLTFWRGDTLNVPLHRLRRSRCCSATPAAPPCRGGINTGWCPSRVYGVDDRRDRPQPALGRRQFGGRCIDPEIDIYRFFANLL